MKDKFSLQIVDLKGTTKNSELTIENNLTLEKNYQADIKQSGSVTVYGDAIPINAWFNHRVYLYKGDFIDYRKEISLKNNPLRFTKKDSNVYEIAFDSRNFFNKQDIIHVQVNTNANTSEVADSKNYRLNWSNGALLKMSSSSNITKSGISLFLKPSENTSDTAAVYNVDSLTLYADLNPKRASITSVYVEFLKLPKKLGTFIPYTDKAIYHGNKLYSQALSLYDYTMITKYTLATSDVVFPVGMSMYDILNEYLVQANLYFSDTTDTDALTRKLLSSELTVEAGKSIQSIFNSVCDRFNYFSPWCDPDGNFVFTPYTDPNNRSVRLVLSSSDFHFNKNIELTTQGLISNRVIAKSKSTENQDSLYSTVVNTNASSYGIAYTGFFIDDYYADVELYDQQELTKYCTKLLENNSLKSSYTVTLYDMLLTDVEPYNRVRGVFNKYATISNVKLDFKAKTTTLELSE